MSKVKVKFKYPYYCFEVKEVEVSEDKWDEIQNMTDSEKADFILNNIQDDFESNWTDKKMIEGALDVGFASIKEITNG